MQYLIIAIISLTITLFSGCGGTTGGNPVTATIVSGAYTNDGSVAKANIPFIKFLNSILPINIALAAPVSELKFCITKMKTVTSVDGVAGSSREAILGLVDVSDSTISSNWGNINISDGESISELHFEIHQDAENCSGADYSLIYNGVKITKDLEFKFKFDPAITVEHGSTLQLNLNVIAQAIENASLASELTNEQISNYLQTNTIGTGDKL